MLKKDILMKTNLFVCVVIVLGFIITSVTSYHSNRGIFRKDVERVSTLTSEGIYHQIDSIFTKPINISLTMANDNLLKEFLADEKQRTADDAFIQSMRDYLMAYKTKYAYDSVFLVSAQTNRYYHFNGLDRILAPGNPENDWYYTFLNSAEEYSLNIDNDEAANNEITVFINCKIKDTSGKIMGVVGVGFRVDSLQALLKEYETRFDVQAYLVDQNGTIEISTDQTGYHASNLFDDCEYPELKDQILSAKENFGTFWYSAQNGSGYLVTQYVSNLEWFLIIDNDISKLNQQLRWQLGGGILIIVLVIGFVLLMITNIIRKYNAQIVKLTVAKEKEHRRIFQEATQQLYENIYELDVTHNCPASEATKEYFESLGVPPNTPYDESLKIVAEKQIKEEFREGYVTIFSPSNVLKAYEDGLETLCYDFMITTDGESYYWMRITARIFSWDDDKSIRMFTYRQNIDAEKQHEKQMLEKMQRDSLSGLYNKVSTQEHIQRQLQLNPQKMYAFFILDIDDFKRVNDTRGHAVGDMVISEFSMRLKDQFRSGDIVGRIGGDEFVAFIPAASQEWIEKKVYTLHASLCREFRIGSNACKISASIGVAIAPEAGTDFDTLYRNADIALYCTKKRGKNGYTIYPEH